MDRFGEPEGRTRGLRSLKILVGAWGFESHPVKCINSNNSKRLQPRRSFRVLIYFYTELFAVPTLLSEFPSQYRHKASNNEGRFLRPNQGWMVVESLLHVTTTTRSNCQQHDGPQDNQIPSLLSVFSRPRFLLLTHGRLISH
jgi:hypothetical protein